MQINTSFEKKSPQDSITNIEDDTFEVSTAPNIYALKEKKEEKKRILNNHPLWLENEHSASLPSINMIQKSAR